MKHAKVYIYKGSKALTDNGYLYNKYLHTNGGVDRIIKIVQDNNLFISDRSIHDLFIEEREFERRKQRFEEIINI